MKMPRPLYMKYDTTRDNVFHIWDEKNEVSSNRHIGAEAPIKFTSLCQTENIASMWSMTYSETKIGENGGRVCERCKIIYEMDEKDKCFDGLSY
jgi:hypothetical protein